jgi:hypothetical protein
MTVETILSELRYRGVELVAADGRLRFRPQSAVTPDLRAALEANCAELLRTLAVTVQSEPLRRDQTFDAGTVPAAKTEGVVPPETHAIGHARSVEPGRCFDCSAELPSIVAIGLCFPCRKARNPQATAVPEAKATPGDEAEAEGPFRVVVEAMNPKSGPIRIAPHLTVTDPDRCIAADLAFLETAVARLNAGWVGRYSEAEGAALDAEEILERLRACGCTAYVTSIS